MDRKPSVKPVLIGLVRPGDESDSILPLSEQRTAPTETDDEGATGLQQITARKLRSFECGAHFDATEVICEARTIAFRILGYVPQRHKWPFIADRICASVGLGTFDRSSEALMIIPL
jgi:hypothetical protein